MPLGRLRPELSGDLERVVATALAKDRQRRYGSADAFAEDLRRYLRHEPIVARSPSRVYRFAKLVRRHRPLVTGVAVAALLGMGGTAFSLHQYVEQEAALREREEEAYAANAAIAFLEDIRRDRQRGAGAAL